MRITVIGCGHLGTIHAACLADVGHEVLGVETNRERRAALGRGQASFYEPGLEELLARHVTTGRLCFTDSLAEATEFADLHFLCVGTPQSTCGLAADVSQVDTAIGGLAPHITRPALVVGKSTVPVGTAVRVAARLAELAPVGDSAELAWNPEFLREGHAVRDSLEPARLVFGVTSERAERTLRDVCAPMIAAGSPVVVTDLATAELVKVAANAFLATKISFINAMAEISEVAGADAVDLADAIGFDPRIGRRFLDAGIGFGGGCLPKDLRALVHRAGELGVDSAASLLREVDRINQERPDHLVSAAISMLDGHLVNKDIGVWGASFKPDSDDVRESPALRIAGELQLRGANVRIYDPRAIEAARRILPALTYVGSALEAAQHADLLLHLTEWEEFREVAIAEVTAVVRRPSLLDGRNRLDLAAWRDAGWDARALGRR